MLKIEPPDTHALSAALGWLELGNTAEALAELDRISESNQPHPAVIEMRWAVYAGMKRWDLALESAEELVRVLPGKVDGWLHRAYALRRARGGGLMQAWEALLPAAEKCPMQPLVAFNLGVETGQLAIAILLLPILWKLHQLPSFKRRVVPVCSVLVALAGAYWLLERTGWLR